MPADSPTMPTASATHNKREIKEKDVLGAAAEPLSLVLLGFARYGTQTSSTPPPEPIVTDQFLDWRDGRTGVGELVSDFRGKTQNLREEGLRCMRDVCIERINQFLGLESAPSERKASPSDPEDARNVTDLSILHTAQRKRYALTQACDALDRFREWEFGSELLSQLKGSPLEQTVPDSEALACLSRINQIAATGSETQSRGGSPLPAAAAELKELRAELRRSLHEALLSLMQSQSLVFERFQSRFAGLLRRLESENSLLPRSLEDPPEEDLPGIEGVSEKLTLARLDLQIALDNAQEAAVRAREEEAALQAASRAPGFSMNDMKPFAARLVRFDRLADFRRETREILLSQFLEGLDRLDSLVNTRGGTVLKSYQEWQTELLAEVEKSIALVRFSPREGEKFDSTRHNAVAATPAPSPQDKRVVEKCTRTGYLLGNEVLRAADVLVYT